MKTSKHLCPKCGGTRFTTVAHVVQTWLVDEHGNFQDRITDCDEVTHSPDDGNTWYCDTCGTEAIIVDCDAKTGKSAMAKEIQAVCQEGVCPVCNGIVEYTDASPDYVHWICPHCNASGDEGADITPLGDKVFDGHHYNVVDGEGKPVTILSP